MGIFTQTQSRPSLAQLEEKLTELLDTMSTLDAIHRQRKDESDHKVELSTRYSTDGDLLLNTPDNVVTEHPPLVREALRATAKAKAELDAFKVAHGGDAAALREQIRALQAQMEAEEQAKVRAAYRANRARLLEFCAQVANLETEGKEIVESAYRRWPVDSERAGIRLDKQAGLIDAGFPAGCFSLSIATAPGSSVYSGVRLLCGLFDESLLPESDPMRSRFGEARRQGMLSGSINFRHR